MIRLQTRRALKKNKRYWISDIRIVNFEILLHKHLEEEMSWRKASHTADVYLWVLIERLQMLAGVLRCRSRQDRPPPSTHPNTHTIHENLGHSLKFRVCLFSQHDGFYRKSMTNGSDLYSVVHHEEDEDEGGRTTVRWRWGSICSILMVCFNSSG